MLRSSRYLLLAACLALAPSLAEADMIVLESNTAKYPRGKFVKGDVIDDLDKNEWVRVRRLEDNTTQLFGDRGALRQWLGLRRRR